MFIFYNTTYQVTAVGVNTEWGLLMASISEDNGEETPLQVLFFPFIFHSSKTIYVVHMHITQKSS
jgi:hypothetical protein